MDKKLMLGAIFAALLLVSMPLVSSVEQSQQSEQNILFSSDLSMLLDQLVVQLQQLHDYLVGLNIDDPELAELLQELQDNIILLEPGDILCTILAFIGLILLFGIAPLLAAYGYFFLAGLAVLKAYLITVIMDLVGCNEVTYCGCSESSASTKVQQIIQKYVNSGAVSFTAIQQAVQQYSNSDSLSIDSVHKFIEQCVNPALASGQSSGVLSARR